VGVCGFGSAAVCFVNENKHKKAHNENKVKLTDTWWVIKISPVQTIVAEELQSDIQYATQ